MSKKVQLGQRVKCKVSGFSGIVEVWVTPLHDAVKACIQAPLKPEGSLGEAYTLDVSNLELLDEGKIHVVPTPSTPKYSLEDVVRDRVTELEGMIIQINQHINGCVRYSVQPKIPKGKKPEDYNPVFMKEGAVEVIKKVKEPKKQQTVGGPAQVATKKEEHWGRKNGLGA